jgi:hypothetical protein
MVRCEAAKGTLKLYSWCLRYSRFARRLTARRFNFGIRFNERCTKYGWESLRFWLWLNSAQLSRRKIFRCAVQVRAAKTFRKRHNLTEKSTPDFVSTISHARKTLNLVTNRLPLVGL